MVEYRKATPAERKRYGVAWRAIGSTWRKQPLATSYVGIEAHAVGNGKWVDGKPRSTKGFAYPHMMGDGKHARNVKPYCKDYALVLCEARYKEWLEARDRDATRLAA